MDDEINLEWPGYLVPLYPFRVLVACEFSGTVRRAFRRAGFDAWSCDLLPAEDLNDGHHFKCDVSVIIHDQWDLMIAHPTCTHIASSGARWWQKKIGKQREALEFMRDLLEADIPHIAVENPVGAFSTYWRKPDQIIQPWQFGHGEVKTTCLWLKNLPLLTPTNIVEGREQKCWKMPPQLDRWKKRSLTYSGIATAMAKQWGDFLCSQSDAKAD